MAIKSRKQKLREIVFLLVETPLDIASLAAFRFLFGLLMAGAMVRFLAKGWVRELYVGPGFHFAYPGFEWIRPWPDVLMHAHFILLALLAMGVALGFCYRVCAVLFFLGFTYVELIDQTAYLNHYYLISLLSGLMVFLPANRAWSMDAWRKPEIRLEAAPAWCLNLLRFQVGVVYVFAGLAKFDADWLFRAQPLRIWLATRSELPVVGPLLDEVWVAYAASWCGAIFDLCIIFFLLRASTRRPAYALLVLFHVGTWLLFNIGMFPWIMIVAATLFFPAGWPRRWMSRLSTLLAKTGKFGPLGARINVAATMAPRPRMFPKIKTPLLCFSLGIYAAAQLVLPLRPYFAPQPAAWTCSGFNCAWQVMIVEKTGYAEFFAFDPATHQRWKLSLKSYLTPRQEMMMAQDPHLIRGMANRLAADLREKGFPQIEIKVNAAATLNGRPSQLLINPEIDLAGIPPAGWILPLTR